MTDRTYGREDSQEAQGTRTRTHAHRINRLPSPPSSRQNDTILNSSYFPVLPLLSRGDRQASMLNYIVSVVLHQSNFAWLVATYFWSCLQTYFGILLCAIKSGREAEQNAASECFVNCFVPLSSSVIFSRRQYLEVDEFKPGWSQRLVLFRACCLAHHLWRPTENLSFSFLSEQL